MRLALILVLSWGVLSLLLAATVDRTLKHSFIEARKAEFKAQTPVLREAIGQKMNGGRLNTETRRQIKEQFNVRLTAEAATQPAAPNSEVIINSDSAERWIATTISVPGADDRQASYYWVRRELPTDGYRVAWRWCFATLFALGAFLILGLSYQLQRHARAQVDTIAPWIGAVTLPQEENLLVLPELPGEGPLSMGLGIVAERVNEVIQQLQARNERSNLVLGNLREGVLAIDDDSRLLLANRAFRNYLELSDENDLYRPLLEVVRNPQMIELVQKVLSDRTTQEVVSEVGTKARTLRLTGRELPLGPERFGAIITVRDETLLKRIENVRRDFIANASHELRTPLAAIRAYAETLQMGALDDREAAEEFVSNIVTQADRIDALVQGMLQLSRVESGSAIQIEWFDAKEALRPCIAAAHATSLSKQIQLTTNLPKSSVQIRSDRNGFQTIASNLLSNAVRYTQPGGSVMVQLRLETEDCILQVDDTGVGLREEDLERVFERFYRADKDRSVETGGTGLGLSIVKHLTNALGGTVSASSKYQAGSRFVVRLPVNGFGRSFLT